METPEQYVKSFSAVSIIDFEQLNVGWDTFYCNVTGL